MKTYAKNIVRSIKESLGRFVAIFTITALGVGFLAGFARQAIFQRVRQENPKLRPGFPPAFQFLLILLLRFAQILQLRRAHFQLVPQDRRRFVGA